MSSKHMAKRQGSEAEAKEADLFFWEIKELSIIE